MANTDDLAQQYADSQKLAARARLNRDYVISHVPWFVWVAQQLGLEGGETVLDVGCGPAWFWAEAAKALPPGLELTLTDASPGMVEEAVQRCKGLPFTSVAGQTVKAPELPFPDSSFDKVTAMHMLYHVPDPATAIAEMFRVLKPGGWLAVTTNDTGNKRELFELSVALGGKAEDPAAILFGYDTARRLMQPQFGNVALRRYPARMRVTNPDDIYLALTSYPPGDRATDAQLTAFRDNIARAFRSGGGALEVRIETGLFLSRKPRQ